MADKDASADPFNLEQLVAESFVTSVELHASLTSTQERACAVAQEATIASQLPRLVLAEEQTAGRGRGGNAWWTGSQSIAFSLLYDPACFGFSKQPVPQASLAAGIAVIDAATRWLDQQTIGLHWPNDVFISGKKLAGILIDVLPNGWHILGIGFNVNNSFTGAPEEVRNRAISLCEVVGKPLNRNEVLLSLLNEISATFTQLAQDPQAVGQRFDELCLQVGHDLTIESAGRRTTGRCAGIAPDGALVLDTLSGRQTFYSGVLR